MNKKKLDVSSIELRSIRFRYVFRDKETKEITRETFDLDDIQVGNVKLAVLLSSKKYEPVAREESMGIYATDTETPEEIFEGDKVRCYGGEHYYGTWEYDETIVVRHPSDCFQLGESEHREIVGNVNL